MKLPKIQKLILSNVLILSILANCQTFDKEKSKPSIFPQSNTVKESEMIYLETKTPDVVKEIRYTLDGSEPTCHTGLVYSNAIRTAGYAKVLVKAIACNEKGEATSSITQNYKFIASEPKFSVASGHYKSAFSLDLSTPTTNATIYYTMDGTNPSCNKGKIYTNSINIGYPVTVKTITCKQGLEPSVIKQENYILDEVVCINYPDENPKFISQNSVSEDNSDIYELAKTFLLFEYLASNLLEATRETKEQERLKDFNVAIEQLQVIYALIAVVLSQASENPENRKYQTSLTHFRNASIHMGIFWGYLKSAIESQNVNKLQAAYDEFINYKLNLLAAMLSIPPIEVSSMAANSYLIIDPKNPEIGYISISLLDKNSKLITTKVNPDDYSIQLNNASFTGTVMDVYSKPKLHNEVRVIFLLSDVSGSMSSTDPTHRRVEAAKRIVNILGPNDILMLGTFGSNSQPVFTSFHGNGTGYTKDCLNSLIDIHFSKANGSTPLYASIGESILHISETRQRIAETDFPITYSILVLTDGDNTYTATSNDSQAYQIMSNPLLVSYLASKQSIPIYTIGLSNAVDTRILQFIAQATNGLFGTTASASGLDEIFSNYSRALEGQTFLKIKFNRNANSLTGNSGRITVVNQNNTKTTPIYIR